MVNLFTVIFLAVLNHDAVTGYDEDTLIKEQLHLAEAFNSRLQKELKLQVDEYNNLYNQLQNVKSLHRNTRQGCGTLDPIVFHARLHTSINPIGDNQIIAYDIVETNIGNAYDKYTGIFQAPLNGVYQFLATMWSYGSNYLEFQMEHNGNDLCYGRATQTNQSMGACFAIIELSAGDRVWIRHKDGDGSYANGDEYPVFSGHRVM